ncbi:MAG: transglutaminase family protein [Verrucomicrobiota bacterium]
MTSAHRTHQKVVLWDRWRTIGQIDARQWTVRMGSDWEQRGGVIHAAALGDGFGGRTFILSQTAVPDGAYEIAVEVKLGEESGAAGLVFCSDLEDTHYGFYPSSGKIRLTRFEGPDVYSWAILQEIETAAYQPGEWNRLRIRVEDDTLTGWVNGIEILQINESKLREGRIGLCKFRRTEADFRRFEVGEDLTEIPLDPQREEELLSAIDTWLDQGKMGDARDLLSHDPATSRRLLSERVEALEEMVDSLEALDTDLHRESVKRELMMALDRPESEIDLFEVGLQIARIDDPELDVDHYRNLIARWANDAAEALEKASADDRVAAAEKLRDFLFRENGFHGSRSEYFHHANSYVNQVLDDREGLPITLSVIYIELARRLELEGIYGAPIPGQFMVGVLPDGEGAEPQFIDVFGEAEFLDAVEVSRLIRDLVGFQPRPEDYARATAREIAVRMLQNLIGIEIDRLKNPSGATDYLDLLLAVAPDSAPERFQRALLRVQERDISGAREDIDWLLEHRPPGLDYARLEQFRYSLDTE